MKRCTKCGELKELSAFGQHKSTKDGLRHLCRECNNGVARKWGKDNPDKAAAKARRWAANNPGRRQEITRKWMGENEGRFKAVKRDYYDRNKETLLAHGKRWANENRERVRELSNGWKQKNAPKVRAAWARRNAGKVQATPTWLNAIQLAQIEEFYEISAARTVQTGVEHHVDHIHPLRGENFRGLHVPWNLQVLPALENIAKGNKLPATFV